MEMNKFKKMRRRAGFLYRLRRKGVCCDTKQRTIYYPYRNTPHECEIAALRSEFGFNIQFEI